MKQKVIASLCALALLLGMIPATALPVAAVEMTAGITHATTTINKATGEFKAGFAKICINPAGDESLPLGGYDDGTGRVNKDANGNTMGQALYPDDNGDGFVTTIAGGTLIDIDEAYDGLFATAIALQDKNGHIAVLISMDGITTGLDVVTDLGSTKGVRTLLINEAKEKLGYTMTPNSIMVNASHSHSGVYMYGDTTSAYRADLRGWLTTVATEALKDMSPVESVSVGSANTEGMNFDRHYYTTQHDVNGDGVLSEEEKQNTAYISGDNKGPWMTGEEMQSVKDVDTNIYMVEFARTGDTPILFVDWRAHPKCNSTATSQYGLDHRKYTSSDYVNAFRYNLEQEGYSVAFFQGAAGNVNTYSDVAGATNAETLNEDGYQTDKLYGDKLAEYAIAGLSSMKPVNAGAIRTTSYRETGNLDYSKKNLYDIISTVTVSELWDTLQSEGLEFDSSDNLSMWWNSNTWDTMKSMTVLAFLADYFDYAGAGYNSASDKVNGSNETVKKVAKALQTHYKINSKYHLGTCYDNRNLTATTGNFTLYAISIGDSIGFVFAPFELFDSNYQQDVLTDLGLDASYGRPFVMGYSNSGAGYMPDSDAYAYMGSGSYEVNQTDYAQGTAEAIAARTVTMLNGLQDAPTAECAYCGEYVDWYNYDYVRGSSNTTAPVGHYYLTQDWEYDDNYQKQVNGQLCLHLNGHSYANQAPKTGKAFVVNKGGVLNLMGTGVVEGQAVKGGSNGGVIQVKGGEVNVYSGVTVRRVDNTAAEEPQFSVLGGIVYIGSGEFNLRGGILENGIASAADATNTYGGGVYVDANGTFKLHSGTVQNCDASRGGAICNYGTTQLLGGSITDGNATVNGGAVYNGGTLIINGTKISGCSAGVLGGSIYNCANVTLTSGEINGGHAATGGNIYNDKTDNSNGVFVQNGGTVTGGNSTGEGGNIYNKGTYEQNTGSLVTLGVAKNNGGNIRNAGIYNQKAGTVSLGDSSIYGGNVHNSGTYTLFEGSITDGETLVSSGTAGNGGNVYQANGSFTVGSVTDTDDALPVISGGIAKRNAGNIWVAGGSFKMFSGTVCNGDSKNNLGNNMAVNGGTVGVYGGAISTAKDNGSDIYIINSHALTVSGDLVITGKGITLGGNSAKLNLGGNFTGSANINGVTGSEGYVLGTAAAGSYLKKDSLTFGDGTYKVAVNGANLILTNEQTGTVVCQILNADGTVKQTYTSFEAAMEAFDAAADASIQLLSNVTYIEDVTKEIKVDMNGFNMAVSILEGGVFYGIEHATDDFDIGAEDKIGVLTTFAGAPAVESTDGTNRYMALPGENSTYTFHAFKLDTKKGLRPWSGENNGTGLYYQGYYYADQMVVEAANNGDIAFGVQLTLDKTQDGGEKMPIAQDLNDFDELQAGYDIGSRVVVYGMMPTNDAVAAQDDPDAYIAARDLSKYPVTGLAYFRIGDTYMLDTDTDGKKTISLKDAILRTDGMYNSMAPDSAQRIGLNKMASVYSDVFASWTANGDSPFENIGKIKVDISDHFSGK